MTPIMLTAAQMRDAENTMFSRGVSPSTLMERAGSAVADAASELVPAGPVAVLCGPGSNGGDGFVAARRLRDRGRDVVVYASAAPGSWGGAAGAAAKGWEGAVRPLAELADAIGDVALVVDALFGIGLSRDVNGEAREVIRLVAGAGVPVLAVDIPSGVDSDTGQARGAAIRATNTVTFAFRKPGHLLYPGRDLCGPVKVVDIGVEAPLVRSPELVANGPEVWGTRVPRRAVIGHKYGSGHAVVLSGGPAHTGAARLAARGALRIGAGLVTVATSTDALPINAAHLTAIMLRVCDDPASFRSYLEDERLNALVLGPALGVGPDTRDWVAAALAADRATVLDADALTSFAGEAERLSDLVRGGRRAPVAVTPHDGEFHRLLAGEGERNGSARAAAAAPSRLHRALAAAAVLGTVVVLKGPDTVIAAPDGRAAINTNGSPHLATAGSGDVLAGMIGGLLAQGMPAWEAAAAAVWLHAEAARRFGRGLVAEDLPETLPAVFAALDGQS